MSDSTVEIDSHLFLKICETASRRTPPTTAETFVARAIESALEFRPRKRRARPHDAVKEFFPKLGNTPVRIEADLLLRVQASAVITGETVESFVARIVEDVLETRPTKKIVYQYRPEIETRKRK